MTVLNMATDSSNYNGLHVLAAVASMELSDTRRFEIDVPENENQEIFAPSTAKRQNKKASINVILTFQEIRCMSGKTLIDKFSEMKSDEYTKKYSYKCVLLPESCSKTYRSFGNEKKAYDEMKMHLLQHVDSLTEEYELNGCMDAVFVPKSVASSSKHVEKMAKKALKKHHASHNGMLHGINNSKKSKKSSLKARRQKFNKVFNSEIKNMYEKVKLKRNLVNNVKENSLLKLSQSATRFLIENELSRTSSDELSDSENYSNYNQYLDLAIYNDAEMSEPSFGSEEMNDSNSLDDEMHDSSNSTIPSWINPHFLIDHGYAAMEGSKPVLPTEYKHKPIRRQNPFLSLRKPKDSPYFIRTPPFPYVHDQKLPNASDVIEYAGVDHWERLPVYHYRDAQTTLQSIAEQQSSDENSSDTDERCSELYTKGGAVSNSVLECVENIENKKHSSSSVPKSGISARENDENLENQQKDERELALKYIAKMHSKGKKKLTDSLNCKICPDKSFTAQATLLHHYRSHAGIKPYSCELCDQRFTRQHSLNYHMLIHENRSRFACNVCGRNFRHPSHFKEHLRRHTGETPYHCNVQPATCNLHFKTRNTFKRHLKTHHGKLLTAGGIEDLTRK